MSLDAIPLETREKPFSSSDLSHCHISDCEMRHKILAFHQNGENEIAKKVHAFCVKHFAESSLQPCNAKCPIPDCGYEGFLKFYHLPRAQMRFLCGLSFGTGGIFLSAIAGVAAIVLTLMFGTGYLRIEKV